MANITKSQKRLFVVLLIVVAYAVYDFASNWDAYFGFYRGKNAQETAETNNNEQLKRPEAQKTVYELSWKTDPFYVKKAQVRTVKKAPAAVKLRLKAISYAGQSSVAMINSKILSTGDAISGYKVLKIEEKKVILGKGANSIVLTLK